MQSSLKFIKSDGSPVPDSYLVKLKDDVIKSDHHAILRDEKPSILSSINSEYNPKIFNGYSAILSEDELEYLLNCTHVEFVEANAYTSPPPGVEDFIVTPDQETPQFEEQAKGSWGDGVDVYVLDTGIYCEHNTFKGRASFGVNYTDETDNGDLYGHGTYVAALAVGITYGLATSAHAISVKVNTRNGGRVDWILDGLNWAYEKSTTSGRQSIVNMSLDRTKSPSLDRTTRGIIRKGLSVVAAAGNENKNTDVVSPAGVMEVNTIGAAGRVDGRWKKWDRSGWGESLKAWAPGVDITSAWIGNPNAYAKWSGTSAAAPAVAGYMAIVLGRQYVSPPNLTAELQQHANPVVTGVPEGTTTLLADPW
ncbi:subtilisin-like protein [Ceratobasidium sp. AG-I]|nr:subtilisin-like protein [Ceratobasidium sp. AG-I]